MAYQFLDHTTDIRVKITNDTLEGLFSDALECLMTLMAPGEHETTQGNVTRVVVTDSSDITALLVDFLNECLTFSHLHHEVYSSVQFDTIVQERLTAKLVGAAVDGFAEDIKAVTYHEAEVKRTAKGTWEGRLVFDI